MPSTQSIERVRIALSAVDSGPFTRGDREYLRVRDDGRVERATLGWASDGLLQAVQKLSVAAADSPELLPALRLTFQPPLRRFLRELGWDADEQRLRAALDAGRPVELSLSFEASELYALPWELLEVSGRDLGELSGVSLRCGGRRGPAPSSPSGRPRALMVASSAGGAVPSGAHQALLEELAQEGRLRFLAKTDMLIDISGEEIGARLARAKESGEPYEILHILAHGRGHGKELHVALYGPDGEADERGLLGADGLAHLLDGQAPAMVALFVCGGAAQGWPAVQPRSLGRAAQEAGAAVSLSFRYQLSVDGSRVAASALYRALDEGSWAEVAVAARRGLSRAGRPLESLGTQIWAAPQAAPVVAAPVVAAPGVTAPVVKAPKTPALTPVAPLDAPSAASGGGWQKWAGGAVAALLFVGLGVGIAGGGGGARDEPTSEPEETVLKHTQDPDTPPVAQPVDLEPEGPESADPRSGTPEPERSTPGEPEPGTPESKKPRSSMVTQPKPGEAESKPQEAEPKPEPPSYEEFKKARTKRCPPWDIADLAVQAKCEQDFKAEWDAKYGS